MVDRVYPTTQGLSALTIPTDVKALRTDGYLTEKDEGGWFAIEVDHDPGQPIALWQRLSNGATRRWELRVSWVTPQQFGAKADAAMNATTGLVTGAFDTAAIDAARDYAYAFGAEMRLTGKHRYDGTFDIPGKGLKIRGSSMENAGVFIETTREKEGFHVTGSDTSLEEFFISVRIPATIQNGQGVYGTCLTVGTLYNPLPSGGDTRQPGESDRDWGLRIAPPLTSNTSVRRIAFKRRPGGGAHAIACTGRMTGCFIEECTSQGWSPTSGLMGSFLLTHWGMTGDDFARTEPDGELYDPLILNKHPVSFTYHPNNVHIRNVRLRNTGRVINPSSSYNISFDGVDIDGGDDGVRGNGVQIVGLATGDEGDVYAHPDDAGKVYGNFSFKNLVGWNIEGSSPNVAGTSLFDWPASGTSKYVNVDGTFSKDDLHNLVKRTIPPIAANGVYMTSIPLAGATVADAGHALAWWDKEAAGSREISATIVTAGSVQITIRNLGSVATAEYPDSDINVAVKKDRKYRQPIWSGVICENWKVYGLTNTENVFNIRNGVGSAMFKNIEIDAVGCVDGLKISNWLGDLTFETCGFPGRALVETSENVTFRNTTFQTSALLTVTLNAGEASGLERGDHIVQTETVGGETREFVAGDIYEVLGSNSIRVRLSKNDGVVFRTGTIQTPAGARTVSSVGRSGDACVLVTGQTSNMSTDGATPQFARSVKVDDIVYSLRVGDVLAWDRDPVTPAAYEAGYVTVTEYADDVETSVRTSSFSTALPDNTVLRLDRTSKNIVFDGCTISGGLYGLQVENADVKVLNSTIRGAWQYGMFQDIDAHLVVKNCTFRGNGLLRKMLIPSAGTRDYIANAGCNGSFFGENLSFLTGQYVDINFYVPSGTLVAGGLETSRFIAPGAVNGPISTNMLIVNPLVGGEWFHTDRNVDQTGVALAGGVRIGRTTYNAPVLAANGDVVTTVNVPGARPGDICSAQLGVQSLGVALAAWCSAVGVVSVRIHNTTSAAKDFAETSLTAIAVRP